ncbi:hypothetical protein HK100_000277 [Physocladia obscura]|uniref:Uncharacterized protein n=1 Tax=Physocladia obscura TaxID=109957 RepID=A0AAD5T031_9FUNG|nr:hypothetical protein HK100_000277 [Physocladia obscura]
MAASILGSTCVAIIFGFISFLATIVSHPEATETNGNPLGSQFGFALDYLFGPKIMMLLVIFCVAFFCFAQAMRFYNHVGLVINVSLSTEELADCLHLTPPSPHFPDFHQTDDEDQDTSIEEENLQSTQLQQIRNPQQQNQSLQHHQDSTIPTPDSPQNAQHSSFVSISAIPTHVLNELQKRPQHSSNRSQGHISFGSQQTPEINKSSKSPSITSRKFAKKTRDSGAERRERYVKSFELAHRIDFVAKMLNRGSMFYTLGMRCFYISFPLMAFL